MQSLRQTSPKIFYKMLEIFSEYHLHPYDIDALAEINDDRLEIKLHLPGTNEEIAHLNVPESTKIDDEKLTAFFHEAASKCQKILISNFYQMIMK